MHYDVTRTVAEGDTVRTDFDDVGEVIAIIDTGVSRIFTLWRPDERVTRVHSSHAWRVDCGGGHPAR